MSLTPLTPLWLLVIAAAAQAQTVRVAGVVVDERQLPISGATVRLTGDLSARTDQSGRFEFGAAVPGRYVITTTSIGFELKSLDLTVARDTSLTIVLNHRTVTLDTMVVRPRNLRIKATAVDSATGDFLMQAQATLYPGGRLVGATSGVLVFDSVSAGPVTIVVEALEHLPLRVELALNRDTTFRVPLGIDSIALRMTAIQVKRLEERSRAISMPTTALNRQAIKREGASTLHELLSRRIYEDPMLARKSFDSPPEDGCYFVDDVKVARGVLDGMIPELVERIEIYRGAGAPPPKFTSRPKTDRNFGTAQMVRIYTKRFVATLPRQTNLPPVLYMGTGLKPTCS
jgi:hypothetical protein